MKKFLIALLVVLLMISGCVLAEGTGLTKDLVVLFTSDVHCGVDQGFTYAGLKAIRDGLEESNYVLLVDDGDSIQGEPVGLMTKGEACIRLMNAMEYDIAIPGNHEFDYTVEQFMKLTEQAEFPYICCNFRKDGELVFQPYIIREFDGVKIGFVGVDTPETLTSSTPRFFQNEAGEYIYDFCQGSDGSAFYAAVQKAVDDVRAEGAEYVFLLAHLGNEAVLKPYTYADVIENTTGIDVLLDGHSHDTDRVVMKNKNGDTVIRQACGTKLAAVGWAEISAETGKVDTGLFTWNNSMTVPELLGIENEMTAKLQEELTPIRSKLTSVIGTTKVTLMINDPEAKDASGKPIRLIRMAETNIGDLAADAYRIIAGADIGFVSGGCFRSGIQEGDITTMDILNVFPFGNKVLAVEATGQQILDALEFGARAVPEENGAFLHPSGLTYEIHTYLPNPCSTDDNGLFTGVEGERRVKNVKVNGEPIDPEKTYTVASLNYTLKNQGDGQTAFQDTKIVWQSDDLDYELLVNYIQNNLGGVIGEEYENPYGSERVVAVQAAPVE